jgi:hypothetical protein
LVADLTAVAPTARPFPMTYPLTHQAAAASTVPEPSAGMAVPPHAAISPGMALI